MNRILKIIFILLMIFSGNQIIAQIDSDHLEPANSIFNIYDYQFEYYSEVRNILFNGLPDNPEFRFLIMPSYTPENVLDISLNYDTEKYFLTYHIAKESIWYSEKKIKSK